MYSGKFPCSLIIIKSKKRVSSTKDYSVHIRTQINIDPVHFTFSPENYATFARSLTLISLCDLFWHDLLSLLKVTGYNLYRTAPNKLINCVRLCFRDSRLCSTYIRVCVISANLAQNRVRLIHEVDLYTDIYGKRNFSEGSVPKIAPGAPPWI